MNILDKIVATKKAELKKKKEKLPLEVMIRQVKGLDRRGLDFAAAIKDKSRSGIVAEYKRRSPSKGVINDRFEVEEIAKAYEEAGASSISVLTDSEYFGGTDDYLRRARKIVEIPILRKEFIVDPYQVYEAKLLGADAILLICECLNKNDLNNLLLVAKDVDLQVLVELHSEEELDKIPEDVDVVGVNNRDLKTFTVDLEKSIDLLAKLPSQPAKLAESGLRSLGEMKWLYESGFDGFLIGETFMKQEDPILFAKSFMQKFIHFKRVAI